MVRLAPGRAEIIDEVAVRPAFVDGGVLTPENGEPCASAATPPSNGVLMVSVVLDAQGQARHRRRRCARIGLPGDEDYPSRTRSTIWPTRPRTRSRRSTRDEREDDDAVEAAVARAAEEGVAADLDARPVVETLVVRL